MIIVPGEIIHDSLSRDNVRARARTNARNGNATRMDELAITREPIRKRTRIGNKCDSQTVVPISFPIPRIVSLPVEIIFEIFSYLSYKDLYAISHVSLFFNRLAYDPFLWRTYEVYIYIYQYRLESSTDLRRKEEEKDYMLKIFIIHSNLYTYSQVTNNEQDTAEVIKELKRMPLLKKFSISVRADCDEILRQISLTNKKLEELHVSNCTGFIFSLSHRQLLSFFPSLSFN